MEVVYVRVQLVFKKPCLSHLTMTDRIGYLISSNLLQCLKFINRQLNTNYPTMHSHQMISVLHTIEQSYPFITLPASLFLLKGSRHYCSPQADIPSLNSRSVTIIKVGVLFRENMQFGFTHLQPKFQWCRYFPSFLTQGFH